MFKLTSKLYAPDGDQGGGAQGGGDQPDKGGDPKILEALKSRNDFLEKELREVIKERDSQKEEKRKLFEKEAEEQGKYKELVEQLKVKISELEGELSEVKPKALAYQEYQNSRIESIKSELGDRWDEDYRSLPLAKIEKLAKTLSPQKVAKTDDGEIISKVDGSKLTQEELEQAEAMGLDAESFLRYKSTRAKLK